MQRPATYSITIIRRSTFRLPIQLWESSGGAPIDLTNKTLISQLWNRQRTEKYLDLTVNVLEDKLGVIELFIFKEQTINLPRVGVYDLKTINDDGTEFFYLTGGFTLQEGYSEGKGEEVLVQWKIDNLNVFDNYQRDGDYYPLD